MSTVTGKRAEDLVASYLVRNGYKIADRNWKTRWCEIDIVAEKRNVIYFVEVKFRRSDTQGEGFEYVTHSKLRQMGFAADMWVQNHHWNGEYVLSAASVDGQTGTVGFLEQVLE